MFSPCPAQRGPLHAVACYCLPPLWGGPTVDVTSYERRHAIACKGAEWTQHTSFLPDAYHVSAMQFLGALTYPNHARLDRTAEENKREGMKTYHSIPARPCTPSQSQAYRELSAQRESFGLSTRSTPPQAVIACVNTTRGRFATAEISASARVSVRWSAKIAPTSTCPPRPHRERVGILVSASHHPPRRYERDDLRHSAHLTALRWKQRKGERMGDEDVPFDVPNPWPEG
ncbi:hypothetical protein B0H13DRAFT_2320366 [Mycena leptocephala]|nr:hypothetical protein B0H13DRAFT_2320366 [Mycena leptocephala]